MITFSAVTMCLTIGLLIKCCRELYCNDSYLIRKVTPMSNYQTNNYTLTQEEVTEVL